MTETVHVLPLGDLIEHEESQDCPCGPRVEWCGSGWVVVHNSLDGREVQGDTKGQDE